MKKTPPPPIPALTQTVQKGGCAAKVSAAELRSILSRVQFPPAHPELLVDSRYFDDAAVYKITDDLALVQTLDFFTPVLDTPARYGAVAAANALSDVYAMGGRPKTAMGILAFPLATMDSSIIVELMQAASDKIREAGANFVGGHSIDDDTLKFGLSVTGVVHPAKVWSNAGAKPGDRLILTKPLGTGTLTAALKRRELTENDMQEAISGMERLNNAVDFLDADQLMAVHAATDITGFGFSGHSMQLAAASDVSLYIETSEISVYPRVMEYLEKNILTKAHRTNAEYTAGTVDSTQIGALMKLLVHDPQTSGGLLLAVSAEAAESIVASLRPHFPGVAEIGRVEPAGEARVTFVS